MLESVAPNIWTVPHRLKMFGLDLSGKMTVVRLSDGSLWLHSPVPLSEELVGALNECGVVKYIVAPNRFHHLYAGAAKERYGDARLYGAPGLSEKRKDLVFDRVLSEAAPPEWNDEFQNILVEGAPSFGEVLFFHRPSRTLIAADFFMNIHQCEGFFSRVMFRLEGCFQRFGVPRFWRLVRRDRDAFIRTVQRVADLDVERVVLAHGENLSSDAGAPLKEALARVR